MYRRQRRAHRGVSLLEVLISIGVTSIGLLGVLALIPLAGAQARRGQVSDRAATIGNGAVSDLRVRGGFNPRYWVLKDGTAPINLTQTRARAFCIDPRGVAQTSDGYFPRIPVPNTPEEGMQRISLTSGVAAPNYVLSSAAADLICLSSDDLALTDPTDKSLPPSQRWQMTDTDLASRRQFEGAISWMATIWPRFEGLEAGPQPYQGTGEPPRYRDLYVCSIVVIHRRTFPMLTDANGNTTFINEEYNADIAFSGGGIAGGDATLIFASDADAKLATTPEDSWLMVTGSMGGQLIYRWYRVLSSDSDPDPTTFKRYVTLDGADWNASATPVRATIIPGTVGVYEKVVKLETSSLWSN